MKLTLKQVLDRHASCIEACLKKKVTTASLVLIHTGLDTVGWLNSTGEYATFESYTTWVNAYLLKAKSLGCSAVELYAARCGLLHTLTPNSKISDRGHARLFCYSWGGAKLAEIQGTIRQAKLSSKYIAVDLNDLYDGWRLGVQEWMQDLEHAPVRKARVDEKARCFFHEYSPKELAQINMQLPDEGV